MAAWTLFGQQATGSSLQADPNPYTLGVQFSVNVSGSTLTGIWFYSAATAGVLPQTIALYAVSGPSLAHSESASWSGPAGSGWVRAAFASPPPLTASASYKACILQDTNASWYSRTDNYWSSGAGSGGASSGPLSAPNNASGDGGQDTFFQAAVLSYPNGSFNSANYWIDPEVTTATAAPDVPQVAPGPFWLRLFKPQAPRPVPPPASASPGVTSSGSLTLAPLAVSAQGGQTSPDQPAAQPGPFWLRLFRPGLQRPVPPPPAVQGINAAGGLTLAPLALSGAGSSVTAGPSDQIQARPGPLWLRLFKPWLAKPAPVNAGQGQVTITSSGGITLAPLGLSGNAEGPAPVVSFGGARWKWTFGAARNR